MQCALPFMLPLEKCVSKEVQLGDKKYNLQFHNHLDRQFIIDPRFGGFPKIRLVPKKVPNQPEAPLPVGQSGSRRLCLDPIEVRRLFGSAISLDGVSAG
jgi:hypothetical protein